jgi:hypothetical protein
MAIWYILWSFGTYFPVLVCCTQKNLATLTWTYQKKMKWNYRRILDLFVWPVLWHLTLAANPHRQLTSGMFVVFQVYSQKTAFDSK